MNCKIVITWDCNLNCSYCCNKYPEIYNSFVPIILSELSKKYRDYHITGGEPLLEKNRIIDILDYLPKEKNIYLYTNGTNLDVNFVKECNSKGLNGINIGYHGQKLDWSEIIQISKITSLIIWVEKDSINCKKIQNYKLNIRKWTMNDCFDIKTDNFYLT